MLASRRCLEKKNSPSLDQVIPRAILSILSYPILNRGDVELWRCRRRLVVDPTHQSAFRPNNTASYIVLCRVFEEDNRNREGRGIKRVGGVRQVLSRTEGSEIEWGEKWTLAGAAA